MLGKAGPCLLRAERAQFEADVVDVLGEGGIGCDSGEMPMVRFAQVAKDGSAAVARHGLYSPDVDARLAQVLYASPPEGVSSPRWRPGGRFQGEAQRGRCMDNGLDYPGLGDDPEVGGGEKREAPRER